MPIKLSPFEGPLGGALRGRQAGQQAGQQQMQQGINLFSMMHNIQAQQQQQQIAQQRMQMEKEQFKAGKQAAKQKQAADQLEQMRKLYGPFTPDEKYRMAQTKKIGWEMKKGAAPQPTKVPAGVLSWQFMNSTDESWAKYAATGYTDPTVLDRSDKPRISADVIEDIVGMVGDNPDMGYLIDVVYGDQYPELGKAITMSPAARRKMLEEKEAVTGIKREEVETTGEEISNRLSLIDEQMQTLELEAQPQFLQAELQKLKAEIATEKAQPAKIKAVANWYSKKAIETTDPNKMTAAQARLFFKDLIDLYGGEQEKAKALTKMASDMFVQLVKIDEYYGNPAGAWNKAKEIVDGAAAYYKWSPEENKWIAKEMERMMKQYGFNIKTPESPTPEAETTVIEDIGAMGTEAIAPFQHPPVEFIRPEG